MQLELKTLVFISFYPPMSINIGNTTDRRIEKQNWNNTLHDHKCQSNTLDCAPNTLLLVAVLLSHSPNLTNFSREEVIYLNPKPRQIIITRPRRAQKHKVLQPNLPLKLLLLPSQNPRGRSLCRYFLIFLFCNIISLLCVLFFLSWHICSLAGFFESISSGFGFLVEFA